MAINIAVCNAIATSSQADKTQIGAYQSIIIHDVMKII